MAPHLDSSSQNKDPYSPEAAGLDPTGPPSMRDARFASAITSFAEMIAPRRRVIRDPYYGAAMPQAPTAPEEARFSLGTWIMIVIAGVALGSVFTLMTAGV
jgi:hypothetical protein